MRGAPAIAIAGALSLAVRLKDDGAGSQFSSAQEAERFVEEQLRYLVTRCLPLSPSTFINTLSDNTLACLMRKSLLNAAARLLSTWLMPHTS